MQAIINKLFLKAFSFKEEINPQLLHQVVLVPRQLKNKTYCNFEQILSPFVMS